MQLHFLRNLSSRWRVISFTLRPLYPRGEIHREPTLVETGWNHIRSGHRGIQQSRALPEFKPRFLGNLCMSV